MWGTINFQLKVRKDGHRYLQEAEMREEGGTPAIVESIRAGMVFQLKEAITVPVIMKREHELFRYDLPWTLGIAASLLWNDVFHFNCEILADYLQVNVCKYNW